MEYLCIRKCFYKDTLYEEGGVYFFSDDVTPPAHFEPLNKETELIESNDEIEILRKKLDSMGKPYDRRWGKANLLAALHEATLEKGTAMPEKE